MNPSPPFSEPGQESAPSPASVLPQSVPVKIPKTPPFAAYTLLGVTVLVFLAQLASEALLGYDLPAALGMKANDWIARGEIWRLLTPMFLHGSILHIAFNMYALHNFGPGLERYFGHTRFLILYFLAGFAGNVTSLIFSPAYSLGSSTAIFGLLGAEGIFLYRNRQLFGNLARRALGNIVMIAAVNLIIGLSPGIDNWGHLGGLVGGTLFAWLGGPVLGVKGMYPDLTLTDRREEREGITAAAAVGGLFGLLALITLYLRGR